MNLLGNRVLRHGPMGRLADAAIVGGAAVRFARRRGLISDDLAKRLGAPDSPAGRNVSIGEVLLVAAALLRLVRHFRSRRSPDVVIEV